MSNGLLPNDTDDRESLARKITADAHLGEVCPFVLTSLLISLPELPATGKCFTRP